MAEANQPNKVLLKLSKALDERRRMAADVDKALAKALAATRLDECKRLVTVARALLRTPRD